MGHHEAAVVDMLNSIAEHSMHGIAVHIDISTARYLIHLHRHCIAAHMIISCVALPRCLWQCVPVLYSLSNTVHPVVYIWPSLALIDNSSSLSSPHSIQASTSH